jgi:hypothetical protein
MTKMKMFSLVGRRNAASSSNYAEYLSCIKNIIVPAGKRLHTKLSGQLANGYLAELSMKQETSEVSVAH